MFSLPKINFTYDTHSISKKYSEKMTTIKNRFSHYIMITSNRINKLRLPRKFLAPIRNFSSKE